MACQAPGNRSLPSSGKLAVTNDRTKIYHRYGKEREGWDVTSYICVQSCEKKEAKAFEPAVKGIRRVVWGFQWEN